MVQDLEELERQIAAGERELPVILLEINQGSQVLEGEISDPKLQLISDWIREYNYSDTFSNAKFVLFQAEAERRNES